MKKYHVLNGDALLHHFPQSLEGDKIILREILIEGPIQKENFFDVRSMYIQETYGVSHEEYLTKSKDELLKINRIPNGSEVYLWFEDDLFCQCNLWYTIYSLLTSNIKSNIFLVRPDSDSWLGFGSMDETMLYHAFQNKSKLNHKQLEAFNSLWNLYMSKEEKIPEEIIKVLQPVIARIEDVIQAHIDRLAPRKRPYESLKKIINLSKDIEFSTAYKKFTEVEGIYGYGDSSIKRMYDQIIKES